MAYLNALAEPVMKASSGYTEKNLLIVDHNEDFRTRLAERLRTMQPGLGVLTAENGEQAGAIIRTTPVDCMITDACIPDRDSRELLLLMKEYRIPASIIVASKYADLAAVHDLQQGEFFFLEKPLDLAVLSQTIRSVIASN